MPRPSTQRKGPSPCPWQATALCREDLPLEWLTQAPPSANHRALQEIPGRGPGAGARQVKPSPSLAPDGPSNPQLAQIHSPHTALRALGLEAWRSYVGSHRGSCWPY
jgi:hypothetical protein